MNNCPLAYFYRGVILLRNHKPTIMSQPTLIKTKDHKEIKQWIESNNGLPARLAYQSTGEIKDPIVVHFPDEDQDGETSYQRLGYDEFFSIFDHYDYTFQYEKDGENNYYSLKKDLK